MTDNKRVALAVTGASGAQYALRLLGCLLDAGCHVYLLICKPVHRVMGMDADLSVLARKADMQRLARTGAVVMPPNPGFYNRPETVEDRVDLVVACVLDQLGVPQRLAPIWGLEEGAH